MRDVIVPAASLDADHMRRGSVTCREVHPERTAHKSGGPDEPDLRSLAGERARPGVRPALAPSGRRLERP